MKLPSDLFKTSISPRKVFYFRSEQLNTSIPHYFICVAKSENDMLILVCCTSQFEKRRQFIESRGFPHSTLVWVPPTSENGLSVDSYVDCNSYFDYTVDEFIGLYESGILELKGEISEDHMAQILIGISDSPLIEDNIKEKFR